LGFLNAFLAQGNGYGGTNFAASCWAPVFSGPGYNGVVDHSKDQLHSQCQAVVAGIGPCQTKGKKILLSLGGAVGPYQLSSDKEATDLADFLWGAFGPKDNSANWPRPFDLNGVSQEVDGFDFDIEQIHPGMVSILSADNEVLIILFT
jgi:chitinase